MSDARPGEILVVDDEEGDIRLLVEGFKEARLPHRLHSVADGEAALAFLRRTGEYADRPRPDLVLLDINLPRLSGLEVLAALKADQSLRQVPVVMMTSSAAERDVAVAYAAGANSYIVKPADVARLVDIAETIDAFWFRTARLPRS